MSTASQDKFDRMLTDLIQHREWELIIGRWTNFVPPLWNVGSEPLETVKDVEGIPDICKALEATAKRLEESAKDNPQQKTYEIIPSDVTGLREVILREAIYLLHKCAHVVGCAENNAQSGRRSWALSDGYQGALFGAKAIMYLLGIVAYEHNDKNYLLDIWPPQTLTPKDRTNTTFTARTTALFVKPNSSLDHRGTWMAFRRLIAASAVKSWPKEVIGVLSQLDTALYTKQRNRIHYWNNHWTYDDLNQPIVLLLDDIQLTSKFKDWLDARSLRGDFSLKLGLVILNLGRYLFKDLADRIHALKDEYDLFQRTIDHHQWHQVYKDLYGDEVS